MMIALIGFNANAAIYMIGDDPMGGWSFSGPGIEMLDTGNGVYTAVVTIGTEAAPKTVYFAFVDGWGTDWDDLNGNHRYGPENGGQLLTGDWASVDKYGDRSFTFIGTGSEYVVTFDLPNKRAKIEGYVAPIEITTYSVVGNFNGWNVNSTDDIMTLVNGVYTLNRQHVELQAGTLQYKFIGNHDYGIYEYPIGMNNNLTEPVEKHGYYDMVITFVPETQAVTCTLTLVEEIEEDPIYTVTGSSAALFGAEWNDGLLLEENEMTKGQDGIYTWTKNNVALTAGNIEFKVVLGHAWGQEWPSSNYVATIENDGNYDVVITFNPDSTKEITFTATEAVVVDDFYTVAGSPESLFGAEWDAEYAANNMTLVNGLYTWTKEEVELAANTFIEFKVVKNANWDTCWPASNYEYTVAEAGTYNLTITYNPETDEVILNVAQPGEPVEITSYTVVGPESVFGSDWDGTDENNDMVLGENGIYTWTKNNVTLYGNFSFKVYGNHSYEVYEWPMGYGNNYDVTVDEEGIYTITITFDPEAEEANRITCTLTKTGSITPVEHVYTVAGTQNLFGSDWNPADEANNMVKGENGIYTWTKNGVEFALNDEVKFKVVQDHAWTYAWPSNDWYWKCEDAGKYDVVITFDPTADDMNKITFTATKQTVKVGDITGEGDVNMDDLTALINYLLTGNGEGMNLDNAAACDGAEGVNMDDLTALINFLLTGIWPEPAVVEHTYTVAGTENLFGSNWNPADEANDMVKGNDGIYTWTKENVEFTEYATIEFKVVEDHSWDNSAWPSSNWWAEITEPGMYNFVITFDPTADDMSKITYTATKQVVE